MPPRRYAILHHVGITSPHFDFLFEIEPGATALTSLRSTTWPPKVGDALDELPEHRRIYLDYEGDVAGNRGRVKRVEAGELEVAELSVDPPTLGLSLRSNAGVTISLTIGHQFEEGSARSLWRVQTMTFTARHDEPE